MPFKSQAQRRWMHAAEDRGELPKGTAKRWADETKNIKSLPERKMKKEGMFFGEREVAEDGNFMKLAKTGCKSSYGTGEEIKLPKKDVTPLPVKMPKPSPPPLSPPKGDMPTKPEKPAPGFDTGGKVAMPFGTGVGIGGSPQFGGSGTAQTQMAQTMTGAGGTPGMGTGGKVKKLKKQAAGEWSEAAEAWKSVPRNLLTTAKRAGRGASLAAAKGAKSLAEASPAVQAAALGIPAYMLYRRGKKAIKSVGKKAPTGGVSTLLRKLLTRGR